MYRMQASGRQQTRDCLGSRWVPQWLSAQTLQLLRHFTFFTTISCDLSSSLDLLNIVSLFVVLNHCPYPLLFPSPELHVCWLGRLQGYREASPSALSRAKGPDPLFLHKFSLCQFGSLLTFFPLLGPKAGLYSVFLGFCYLFCIGSRMMILEVFEQYLVFMNHHVVGGKWHFKYICLLIFAAV